MPTITSASVKAYLYDTFVPKVHNKPENPIKLLKGLNHRQRLTFAAAFMAWMVDAIDFFTVSLSATEVAAAFGKDVSDVTSAITTTLMLRPIGALIFGVLADRYGRRIPLMIDLALFTVIEVATGFSNNLSTFIGLRAVFGICMGGEWGLGNALAMETPSRLSRHLYQLTLEMLKKHWLRCIYAVLLMAGFNFMSHGSQDLYPTFLKVQLGYSASQATVATVVMNIGAIIGGLLVGYLSEYYGRRTMIIWASVLGLCFLPLWMLPTSYSPLVAGAFFMQFCVQGAWGVIPVHLAELSPPGFRSTFPGLAYQLGNLISASASQIEAVAGAHHKLPNGKPDYARAWKDFMASDDKELHNNTEYMEDVSLSKPAADAIDGEEKGIESKAPVHEHVEESNSPRRREEAPDV
ncbi:hypothetical protein BGX26_001971 [Mortierella sp. AD094]|nr:hypothetical protein BGX26_001971 [Mortierella sp. AD094]